MDNVLNKIDLLLHDVDPELTNFIYGFTNTEVGEVLESNKSQFVGKLIGLGVLKKDKNGKLVKVKDIDSKDIYKSLGKKSIGKTVKKAVRKVVKKLKGRK